MTVRKEDQAFQVLLSAEPVQQDEKALQDESDRPEVTALPGESGRQDVTVQPVRTACQDAAVLPKEHPLLLTEVQQVLPVLHAIPVQPVNSQEQVRFLQKASVCRHYSFQLQHQPLFRQELQFLRKLKSPQVLLLYLLL